MNKVYTDIDSIRNKVYDDYRKYATELNGLFFDFEVDMLTKAQLLQLYASIQKAINGDDVMRLEDVIIEGNEPNDMHIWGKEAENFIPEGKYQEIYKGNYKDFLESFNDRETETGFCRVLEAEEKGDLIGGDKLDFVY